ncbi:hypothetical protein BZA77DRAFT_347432 [Pyronema omphalodes]|nr:hypothetical protein BZA77DRAFT_347432 [Pyronema omphalodes]
MYTNPFLITPSTFNHHHKIQSNMYHHAKPAHSWPNPVAADPNTSTRDNVTTRSGYTYYDPLADFPPIYSVYHTPYEHRQEFPDSFNDGRSQDPATEFMSYEPRQVTDEEIDELAVYLGRLSLDRHHGWVEELEDRQAASPRWIAFAAKILVGLLVVLVLWNGEKQWGGQVYQDFVKVRENGKPSPAWVF